MLRVQVLAYNNITTVLDSHYNVSLPTKAGGRQPFLYTIFTIRLHLLDFLLLVTTLIYIYISTVADSFVGTKNRPDLTV